MIHKPISFSSFGGYRRWCAAWWMNLLRYMTGISYDRHSWEWWEHVPVPRIGPSLRAFFTSWSWKMPGWVSDIYTCWHRGRYGWAPRDTWSLDDYLDRVIGQSLLRLAQDSHGSPHGYPHKFLADDGTTMAQGDYARWVTDLTRWGNAFLAQAEGIGVKDHNWNWHDAYAEETRLRNARNAALAEMIPWWDALWN